MGSGGGRGDEAAQGQPYEQRPATEFVDGVGNRRHGAGDGEGLTSPAAVAGQIGCRGGVVFSDGLDHGLPHRAAHTQTVHEHEGHPGFLGLHVRHAT